MESYSYKEPIKKSSLFYKKLKFNHEKNLEQDHTQLIDRAAAEFNYDECKSEYWNPEKFSLLYGTPFWDQASAHQKVLLNQLYWVAYYSQIISAEIATIYFNQVAAAGLYQLEDFRLVCDTLDLESSQERAHINGFKSISEQVEQKLFGKRLFTYPMRPYFHETMLFQNTNTLKKIWKRFQLQFYTLLSSGNAFIACQYLTVRGLRTLNGKIIQDQLSKFYLNHPDKENAPLPSKVSYYHFCDESHHFNSSNLIGTELLSSLKAPTKYESFIANLGVRGSLKDHSHFNVTVNGIFWYEPSIYPKIFELFTGPLFRMEKREAIEMMKKCFCQENDGISFAHSTHNLTRASYKTYLQNIDYLTANQKSTKPMKNININGYIKKNYKELKKFERVAYAQ